MPMHEVDYEIVGDDLQYVKIELDPGEAAIAEAGAMMYLEDGIEMETVFGDGSQPRGGFMDSLIGAGKRLLIGEPLFMPGVWNRAPARRRAPSAARARFGPSRCPSAGSRAASTPPRPRQVAGVARRARSSGRSATCWTATAGSSASVQRLQRSPGDREDGHDPCREFFDPIIM